MPDTGTVPLMLAVTEPIWAVPATRAGSVPMVTELPTVTEEIEMGTVPLMLAVTLPICAVLAPRVTVPDTAGIELTVTVVDTSETGCVA